VPPGLLARKDHSSQAAQNADNWLKVGTGDGLSAVRRASFAKCLGWLKAS
jgi:hypothetical protein